MSRPLSNARLGRDYIARHGETVYNLARRIQGEHPHTPLTRAGFAQADEIGAALAARLGPTPKLTLWASPTGRALQTLAVVAERLGLDWHDARTDERLREIGMGDWGGRYYADVFASEGARIDPVTGFLSRAPQGEWYHEIAERVSGWLADTADDAGDRLVISHGVTSRVLRGVMLGLPAIPEIAAPLASGLPQGSVVLVENGQEEVVHLGTGQAPAS
jgi:glucosyl-3-phosphoglycerate phosphatase